LKILRGCAHQQHLNALSGRVIAICGDKPGGAASVVCGQQVDSLLLADVTAISQIAGGYFALQTTPLPTFLSPL